MRRCRPHHQRDRTRPTLRQRDRHDRRPCPPSPTTAASAAERARIRGGAGASPGCVPANSATGTIRDLKAFYDRLIASGKKPKVAITGACESSQFSPIPSSRVENQLREPHSRLISRHRCSSGAIARRKTGVYRRPTAPPSPARGEGRRGFRRRRRPQSASAQHDDLGADVSPLVEVGHVVVCHADASGGDRLADRIRLVGAVDAIERAGRDTSRGRRADCRCPRPCGAADRDGASAFASAASSRGHSRLRPIRVTPDPGRSRGGRRRRRT